MLPLPNEFAGYSIEETDEVDEQLKALSPVERRRRPRGAWREAKREHLQKYLRRWKAEHPDRVKLHRQHEYARRRLERCPLRLRREAQRRRRAIKRAQAINRYQYQAT